MTILLVDSFIERLHGTALMLQSVVPDGLVMSIPDPLMAAKYAFNNPVSMLFTELNMKRMNGLELCDFVHEKNPDARLFLLASRQEFEDCPDVFESFIHPIALPVAQAELKSAIEG